MESQKLFVKRVAKLEELPAKPKVFWYVSAGDDFRGPVFLTQYHIDHEARHHGRDLEKPDLFVYNCLGQEVEDLKSKLSSRSRVELFNDGGTRIVAKNYQVLDLNEDVNFQVNPDYIEVGHVLDTTKQKTAFYFELDIINRNYIETQKILYFEAENIDFFKKIILSDFFETRYLCATREGMAYGNCKKSIIDYIYRDAQPSFYTENGFRPKYNILFYDFTNSLFQEEVAQPCLISAKVDYVNYICDSSGNSDASFYKLDYAESA